MKARIARKSNTQYAMLPPRFRFGRREIEIARKGDEVVLGEKHHPAKSPVRKDRRP